MKSEIIPAIIAKTREELLDKIMAVELFVERVHLDIADGIFVPNMTIMGFEEIETLETNLKIGVHLMVSKPENHIVRWLETPADQFIFHVEATDRAQFVIDAVREAEKTIGIAVNPQTPTEKIAPFVDQVDFVHFMTVEPGFYGGAFIESIIDKIKDFHFYYPDKSIEVDGGVTPDNAGKLIEAGVTMLVAGSYIFKNGNAGDAIKNLSAVNV